MTFLCIPARLFFLPRFFEGWELVLLDGEDEEIEEWIDAKEESIRNFEKRSTISLGADSEDGDTTAVKTDVRLGSSDDESMEADV